MKGKSRRGFTLIELMVVVTIICILATIAVPNFMKYRDTTLAAKCIANLRSIQDSREAYFLEFPDASQITGSESEYLRLVGEAQKGAPGAANSFSVENLKCPKGGSTYSLSCELSKITDMPVCPNSVVGHVYSGN